jgi:hypothetical protein
MSVILMVVGGILFGGVIAGVRRLLASRSDDHLVELTLTGLAAYGSSSRPGGQDAEGGLALQALISIKYRGEA